MTCLDHYERLFMYCSYIVIYFITVTIGQMPWNHGMSSPNRIPGLHPVGGTMAFPEFLVSRSGYISNTDENAQNTCPSVNRDCPELCRTVDENKCRVCDCKRQQEVTSKSSSQHACPKVPTDCPTSCRKRDEHSCKICRCEKETDNSRSTGLSGVASTTYNKCYGMIMCMLSCKEGYTLGSRTDSRGCQACHCMDADGAENKQPTGKPTENKHDWDNSNGIQTDNIWGDPNGSTTSSGTAAKGSSNWSGSGHRESETGGGVNLWETSNGVGNKDTGCSGPMCPGSSGLNPMSPGSSMNSGLNSGTSQSSCTGPFCMGQDGGMGGGASSGGGMAMGGGSGSGACTGPFCITGGGGMMSGGGGGGGGMMSGGGASAGMGGASAGMGGASGSGAGASSDGGGMMGGPGGVGAFSPFGMAATGGGSGGCSGPFCTVASSSEKDIQSCTGPSCSGKDGQGGTI